jgi:hypothetical protein
MTLVLLVVGLLATAAGFVTIGFGIPINAFSLGNTLILAGTLSVATGLILIGLAAVLGQLRRIGEALNARAGSYGGRAAESVEPILPQTARLTPVAPQAAMPQPPMPPKMPAPPKPPEMHDPEPQPLPPHFAEPRFPAAASSEPAAGPLDWLRAKPRSQGTPYPGPSQPSAPPMSVPQPSMSQSAAPRPNVPFPGMTEPPAPEPPMVEVSDEAPLSPRPPQRPAMPPPMHEPTLDSRAWSPAPASHARGSAEAQPMSRATPLPTQPTEAPPRDKDGFDMAWPEPRTASSEPAAREERPEPPPLPAAIRQREETPVEPRRAESAAKPASKPATERGPAILKSGVIDGMPYTLYADGSIEAELPQGVVKFASVDALRSHLEKQG